jgi:hypothetical protein
VSQSALWQIAPFRGGTPRALEILTLLLLSLCPVEQKARTGVNTHPPKTDCTRRGHCERTRRPSARAEALFKKEEQMREGEKAMAEYKAAQQAIREKTARLRALRLARDAAKQSRH